MATATSCSQQSGKYHHTIARLWLAPGPGLDQCSVRIAQSQLRISKAHLMTSQTTLERSENQPLNGVDQVEEPLFHGSIFLKPLRIIRR